MDDLDNSLPSRSTFAYTENAHRPYTRRSGFGASHAAIDEEEEYLYYDHHSFDEAQQDSVDVDRSVAPSPPPPPPPPPVPDLLHTHMDEAPVTGRPASSFTVTAHSNGSHATSGSGNTTPKQRHGPFPFLKKNSRKEPSALHKKPSSPESTQAHPQTPFQHESRTNRTREHRPSAVANTTTIASSASSASSAMVRSTNEGDILLSGEDYWGLDGSIAQDLQAIRSSRPVDYMEESTLSLASTVSIGLNDWRRAKPNTGEDIHDFAVLEQRAAAPPPASTSRPQRPSTQQSSFHRDEDDEHEMDNDSQSAGVETEELTRHSRTASSHGSWGPTTQPRGFSKTASVAPLSSHPDPVSASKAATMQRRSMRDSSPTLTSASRTSGTASVSSRTPVGQAVEDGRLLRPSSTMRTRGASPGPPSSRKPPAPSSSSSSHAKNRLSQTAKPSSTSHTPSADAPLLLDDKARELEAEIETYRQENAQLKRLRKQQESGLLELAQKKEEVLKFCEAERARTLEWCEEQRTAAEREKRAVAKQVREMRNKASTGSLPLRKEKAEAEAAQASLDKLKQVHEAATKKWKLTENRLYGVIKDHSAHIDRLDQQVLLLEEQKIALLDYIAQNGLRLPKSLRAKVLAGPETTPGGKTAERVKAGQTFAQNPRLSDRGYVEEVDVEEVVSNPHGATGTATHGSSSSGHTARLSMTTGRALGGAGNVSMSWARSSKSSARYSSSSFEAEDLDGHAEGYGEAGVLEDTSYGMGGGRVEPAETTRKSFGQTWQPVESGTRTSSSSSGLGGGAGTHAASEASRSAGIALSATVGQGSSPSAPASTPASVPSADTNGRTEETLPDGSKRVHYRNGTIKTVDPQGRSTVVFTNGDTKRTDPRSGTVVYYYCQADTTHTTFPDGLEVYEFPNKQMERHHPDGRKEVIFPDKTRKVIETDGTQESHFPDGVVLREYSDGRKEVLSTGR